MFVYLHSFKKTSNRHDFFSIDGQVKLYYKHNYIANDHNLEKHERVTFPNIKHLFFFRTLNIVAFHQCIQIASGCCQC